MLATEAPHEVLSCDGKKDVCLPGLFFFFQAEDGIRDLTVTGVQTCALPISHFCVSVQGFSSVQVLSNAIERLKGSPASPGPKRVFRTVVSELARGLTCPCKPVDRKSVV